MERGSKSDVRKKHTLYVEKMLERNVQAEIRKLISACSLHKVIHEAGALYDNER